jgi:hypothetical protein
MYLQYGNVRAQSGSNVVNVNCDDQEVKQLLLDEEHQLIFIITTAVSSSSPQVTHPAIHMKWNDGTFQILSAEGWDRSSENELHLDRIQSGESTAPIRLQFFPRGVEIGILIVGTGELP